jgi:hypothetical protein
MRAGEILHFEATVAKRHHDITDTARDAGLVHAIWQRLIPMEFDGPRKRGGHVRLLEAG